MAADAELDAIVSELKAEVPVRPELRKRGFRTYRELRAYFEEETAFWNPLPIQEVKSKFQEISSLLVQAESVDTSAARSNISRAITLASDRNIPLIFSSTSRGKLLKSLAAKNAESANAAFAYFKRDFSGPYGRDNPLGTPAGVDGVIAAVLHANPKLISESTAAEVQAFSEQRDAIDKFSNETADRFHALKQAADTWQESTQKAATKLLEDNEKAFADEHRQQSETFEKSSNDWDRTFKDLEKVYREKLRLQEPAKYWKDLEEHYVAQGRWWIVGTLIVVLGLTAWVTHLIYVPPDILTVDKFTLGGFKGTILIVAAISAFLYVINLFVKVATSSYHLARDARERYQLTHVFLALIKDAAIESADREVILSALFSRSDTGLLKGDSGPTLPTPLGSILDHLKGK